MSGSRLSWFATENGRKCIFYGLTCTGVGLMFGNILPHTVLMYKYKEVVQLYRAGLTVPVPQNVEIVYNKVIEDLDISPFEKKLISPFTVFGFDIFHAGSTTSKYGAILGIPASYSYETTEDVDKQNILVTNEPVDWTTRAGQELQNALVLTEKAKKFAICREISSCQTIQPFLNGIYPTSILVLMYSFTYKLNRRLELFLRPVGLRGLLYSITGLFGFGMWAFLKDYTTVYYETAADKHVCKLGKDYIEGGIEFYQKTLQRNVALRELMGKKGEKLYSVLGNEAFFVRQKRLPIGHRKTYMELMLKELRTSTDNASADNLLVDNS